MMNDWVLFCFEGAVFFLAFALVFGIGKEKSTILISGFNTLSKEDRMKYDRQQMSKDMRNQFLLWACVLFVGGLGAYVFNWVCAVVAYAIWLILFIKDVHWSIDKAFGKYLLK